MAFTVMMQLHANTAAAPLSLVNILMLVMLVTNLGVKLLAKMVKSKSSLNLLTTKRRIPMRELVLKAIQEAIDDGDDEITDNYGSFQEIQKMDDEKLLDVFGYLHSFRG